MWHNTMRSVSSRGTSRLMVCRSYSYQKLLTTRQVTSRFIFGSQTETSQAFPAPVPLPMLRRELFRLFSSTTPAERADECGLLQGIEEIVEQSDLPKIERALLELTASNYSEQLENLGVEPPEPGWGLNQLLTSGAYLDKEQYYRKIVYRSDKKNSFRKSFVSYPRRWGKSVMIEAAARILRWGSVNASAEALDKAKKPVLMLDFKGKSIGNILEYICDEIDILADVEGLYDQSKHANKLESRVTKNDAVGAIDMLSKALELKNKKRPLHVLVDEYDFPVIDSINPLDNKKYAECMKFYQRFFAATKSVKGAIVVTGVSRIGMAGVFSGANHLDDVTFEPDFNGLLGLSWSEIVAKYGKALPLIAKRNKVRSIEELRQKMIAWYDGYRWDLSEAGNDCSTLFNPFSVHQLVRKGVFETYWANTGHSDWILNQGICKSLLRTITTPFKLPINHLKARRIEYKHLGVQSGSIPDEINVSPEVQKLRFLVALHAGYLSIASVNGSDGSANIRVPNMEVSTTALDILHQYGVPPWRRYLDEGVLNDDVRVMMKGMSAKDGFLSYWREGASIDPLYRTERVMDISESWLEDMLSFMLRIGGVRTAMTQFKVPKGEPAPGAHPALDVVFNGSEFAHVIELKKKGTHPDKVVSEQLQGYARSERLKGLLDDWKKTALFWAVYFDASHFGEKEEVFDLTKLEFGVEGPYELDKNRELQLRKG